MTATISNKAGHSPNEMSYFGFTSSAPTTTTKSTTFTMASISVAKAEPSIAFTTLKKISVVPLLGSATKRSVSGQVTLLLTDQCTKTTTLLDYETNETQQLKMFISTGAANEQKLAGCELTLL